MRFPGVALPAVLAGCLPAFAAAPPPPPRRPDADADDAADAARDRERAAEACALAAALPAGAAADVDRLKARMASECAATQVPAGLGRPVRAAADETASGRGPRIPDAGVLFSPSSARGRRLGLGGSCPSGASNAGDLGLKCPPRTVGYCDGAWVCAHMSNDTCANYNEAECENHGCCFFYLEPNEGVAYCLPKPDCAKAHRNDTQQQESAPGECCTGTDACLGFTGCVAHTKSEFVSADSANNLSADLSCNGTEACANATLDLVAGASCQGERACQGLTSELVFKSCEGDQACANATVGVARWSCYGEEACKGAEVDKLKGSSVGDTCDGYRACMYLGADGGAVGNVTKSCVGEYACESLGRDGGALSRLVRGCKGARACQDVAKGDGAALAEIASSCHGREACQALAENRTLGAAATRWRPRGFLQAATAAQTLEGCRQACVATASCTGVRFTTGVAAGDDPVLSCGRCAAPCRLYSEPPLHWSEVNGTIRMKDVCKDGHVCLYPIDGNAYGD